jgi:nicotinamide-nucleotide amidase
MTAIIITIGDELLIGQTIDTNSAWIAQQLNGLGIEVARRVAVGDTGEAILGAVHEELSRTNILIITGGLGPTSDDITKPLLAEYFGDGTLVEDPDVLAHVTEIFAKRKRPLLEVNRLQAHVPAGCTVLHNRIGTAPGMLFWKDGKAIVSLPGVPYEMQALMEDEVLPRLRKDFVAGAIVHRTIVTAGEGESFVAERLQDLERTLPAHIKLAYLPSPGTVRLRLTGRGEHELSLIKEVELHRDAFASRLGKLVVSLDDLPLEHILGKRLTAKGLKLGLAESCTGGYVAHKITDIMGSAGYLQGSVVCYQESVKEQLLGVQRCTIDEFCVVSEEVAREMATGARTALEADIGFGVTGLLSPGGEDRAPVGTVWMACTDGERTTTKHFFFTLDRARNKELAVQNALIFIWRFIEGQA